MTPEQVADRVILDFRARGHRSYGERVTESQHALQAAHFAARDGQPETLVAACLLHDYGHLLHDLGEDVAERGVDADHESLGADALAAWFPPEVVEPVRLHVAAKRYLCAADRAYFDNLSDASRLSLQLQGGPMTESEARAFERHPHFPAALRLRRYDDLGKVPDMPTPDWDDFRQLLVRVARLRTGAPETP